MGKYTFLIALFVYALLIDVVILALWWRRKRRRAAAGGPGRQGDAGESAAAVLTWLLELTVASPWPA